VTGSEALGLLPDERVAVIHVDDLGLCTDANEGGLQALEATATCGSIMVPCPGFAELVERVHGRRDLDLGVHLTLNCEFADFRWGPVRDDVPSLCEPDGTLLRTSEQTAQRASQDDVRRELRAQLDHALASGIDVTHIDAHMGTALLPDFIDVYIDLACEYRLPAFIPRITEAQLAALGLAHTWSLYRPALQRAERSGIPLFDGFELNSLHFTPGQGLEHNRTRVSLLGPGLSYLIVHCARGGEQLRAIAPDWRQRAEEHELYSDGTMGRMLAEQNVRTVGMRPLRDWLRRRPGFSAPVTARRSDG
jgi:predicted glycoside hydrolase/deacetylase ChbG (UPF0249 family)